METNLEIAENTGLDRAPSSMLFPSEKNFFLETAGSDMLLERLMAQARRGDADEDGANHLDILEGRFQAWRKANEGNPDLTNKAREAEAEIRMDILLAVLEPYGVEEWEIEQPMGATVRELLDASYRFFVLGRRERVLEWAWLKINTGFAEYAKAKKALSDPDDAEVAVARKTVGNPAAALVLADLERITADMATAPEVEEGKSALEELTLYDPSRYENQVALEVLDNHFGPRELAAYLRPLASGSDAREDLLLDLRARLIEEHKA